MVEPKFKCNVCKDNKIYSSQEANEHRKKTEHNDFRITRRQKLVSQQADGKEEIFGKTSI